MNRVKPKTPRTDAQAFWPSGNDDPDTYNSLGTYVCSDFARELELELEACLILNARLAEGLTNALGLKNRK